MFLLYIKYLITVLALNSWKHVESQETSLQIPEELVKSLYEKYKEAFQDESKDDSLRRLFTKNKAYEIHVKKLKGVNGFKTHNLLIKGLNKPDNPLIYINNPVESHIPNAFLSLNEFRDVLTNRIQKEKDELSELNKHKKKRIKVRLHKGQKFYRPTRTNSKLRSFKIMTTDIMIPSISTNLYMVRILKNKKYLKPKTSKDVIRTTVTTKNTVVSPTDKSESEDYESVSNSENISPETTRHKLKVILRNAKTPALDSLQSIEDHTLGTTDYPIDPTTLASDSAEEHVSSNVDLSTKSKSDITKSDITSTTTISKINIHNEIKYSSTDKSYLSTKSKNYETSKPLILTEIVYNQSSPTEFSTLEPTKLLSTNDLSTQETIPTESDEITDTNRPENVTEITNGKNTTNIEVEDTIETPAVIGEENEEGLTTLGEESTTLEETSTVPSSTSKRAWVPLEDDAFNAFLPMRTGSRVFTIRTTTTRRKSTTKRRTLGRPNVFIGGRPE